MTEAGQLLGRFAGYLAVERGLAPRTVALNVGWAGPFLQQRALDRDGHLEPGQLTVAEVRAFVMDQARRQPRSAKRIVTSLRMPRADGRRRPANAMNPACQRTIAGPAAGPIPQLSALRGGAESSPGLSQKLPVSGIASAGAPGLRSH